MVLLDPFYLGNGKSYVKSVTYFKSFFKEESNEKKIIKIR